MRHVVWDWNGTLLDDFPIIMSAVNEALAALGFGPINAEAYRDHFTRPVPLFYERLLQRPLSEAQFALLDERFYAAYRSRVGEAKLYDDAHEALEKIAQGGGTQSLLSMLKASDLQLAMDRHGIEHRFVSVQGLGDADGPRKSAHLARHLRRIRGLVGGGDLSSWLLIGDSVDDALAASDHGLPCVLLDGGSHHRHDLGRTGAAVATTLLEALEIAGW